MRDFPTLRDIPTLQYAGAVLAIAFVLIGPLWPGRNDDNSFGQMCVAISLIMGTGATAENMARSALNRSVFLPEIVRLAVAADAYRSVPTYARVRDTFGAETPTQPRSESRTEYARSLSFQSVQLVGLMYVVLALCAGMLVTRWPSEVWRWRAPVALAVSEVIYLAWLFEALALKTELELIARRWDRLNRLAQTVSPIQVVNTEREDSKPEIAEFPEKLVLDEAWAKRVRDLLSALGEHGLHVQVCLPTRDVTRNFPGPPEI